MFVFYLTRSVVRTNFCEGLERGFVKAEDKIVGVEVEKYKGVIAKIK